MILPDVNVLIGAFRQDGEHHILCKSYLEDVIRQGEPFGISTLALSAVLRITTAVKFHSIPSTVEEVFRFSEAFLSMPNCVVVEPGARHWTIFETIVKASNARAKLVTDAWFAALAIEHGCEWVTLDRDFAKFPGLKWRLLK